MSTAFTVEEGVPTTSGTAGLQGKVGLAMSGGTLKAAAHVGVLEALESLGIHVDCVAGTSAGSFVSALYAHSVTPAEMLRMIEQFPAKRLLDYGFPVWSSLWTLALRRLWPRRQNEMLQLPSGLLRGKRLERYFRGALSHRSASIPYAVIATDLYSGRPVVYTEPLVTMQPLSSSAGAVFGSMDGMAQVAAAIRGSCAMPGVFTPVRMDPYLLADGGLRTYVPVEVLRALGCTKIIAVNLYHLDQSFKPETFAHVLIRSVDIMLDETVEGDLQGDDVYRITPDVSHMSWLSFEEMLGGVDAGRQAVLNKQHEILAFLTENRTGADLAYKQIQTGKRQPSSPVLSIRAAP